MSVGGRWLLGAFMLACGGDKPTEPEVDYVGNWRMQSAELPAASADNLAANLRAMNVPSADADETVREFRSALNEGVRDAGFAVLRINSDGTWEDNDGTKGTYTVSGDRLTFSSPGEPPLPVRYFATSTTLTLNVSVLELAKQLGELLAPGQLVGELTDLLTGVDIRMVFQKI